MNRYTKGRLAERQCAEALTSRNWTILAERLQTPVGEIDLLARDGDTLVAVEVKARKSVEEGLLSISPRQQRRIMHALLWFVGENPEYETLDLRLDCMIAVNGQPPYHVENAWMDEHQ